MRHGKGKMEWLNNYVYEGDWENNKRQGYGRLTLSDGDTYQGQFKADMFDGVGEYHWAGCGKYYKG